jgi:hypothetical protein
MNGVKKIEQLAEDVFNHLNERAGSLQHPDDIAKALDKPKPQIIEALRLLLSEARIVKNLKSTRHYMCLVYGKITKSNQVQCVEN